MGQSNAGGRPTAEEHFINRAKVAAEMSTCLRRAVGAVIIRDGVELSSGYVGAPRRTKHCSDEDGRCFRQENSVPSGERYELCRSAHAEQNAIINAARIGVNIVGGTMYIYSRKRDEMYEKTTDEADSQFGPCILCKRFIINAGIKQVVMKEEGREVSRYNEDDVRAELRREEDQARSKYSEKQADTPHSR